MGEFAIEYEPRLVEETALCALRGCAEESEFRRKRDRLYEIADFGEREAAFRAFHAAWFERLGLGREINEVVQERPSVAASTARCLVAYASSAREEGAELFVSPGSGADEAPRRAVLIWLRPETLTFSDQLRFLLRHELTHIADMLDPRFGYEPRIPVSEAGPAREPLLQERYRVLWDAFIDGRLARLGWAPAGIRAERLHDFTRAFPMLRERTREVFDRFFEGTSLTHADLVAFAADPEGMLGGRQSSPHPGERCPLCRFPTHDFEPEPGRLPQMVRDRIQKDFPEWEPARGLCRQCAELHCARSLHGLRDSPGVASVEMAHE